MDRLSKLYDFLFGAVLGGGAMALALHHNDLALALALIAVALRLTLGRAALDHEEGRTDG